MAKRQTHTQPSEPLSLSELDKIFEVVPLSDARANLSQIVEQVAYSGAPVIISKHDRSRVAVVPLDLLARDRARFVKAATRVLKRREARQESTADDVAVEDIGSISDWMRTFERDKRVTEAREEDRFFEAKIAEIVNHPAFRDEVMRMATNVALKVEALKVEEFERETPPPRSSMRQMGE